MNVPECKCPDSKYAKILNMAGFSIYTRICLDRVLNISLVSICQYSKYGRALNMQELHIRQNIAEYVWIRHEYAWLCLNLQ